MQESIAEMPALFAVHLGRRRRGYAANAVARFSESSFDFCTRRLHIKLCESEIRTTEQIVQELIAEMPALFEVHLRRQAAKGRLSIY